MEDNQIVIKARNPYKGRLYFDPPYEEYQAKHVLKEALFVEKTFISDKPESLYDEKNELTDKKFERLIEIIASFMTEDQVRKVMKEFTVLEEQPLNDNLKLNQVSLARQPKSTAKTAKRKNKIGK